MPEGSPHVDEAQGQGHMDTLRTVEVVRVLCATDHVYRAMQYLSLLYMLLSIHWREVVKDTLRIALPVNHRRHD